MTRLSSADIAIIWNAGAGGADAAYAIRERLAEGEDMALIEVKTREETVLAAREAADAGAGLVVAAGGDGTVNAVVNGLMQTTQAAALGVLPVGTANDFARSLAMPLDPLDAVQCLRDAATRPIDVVQTTSEATPGESHYFINMATAGNSERVLEHLTPEQKEWWGPLCYLRGALDVALDLKSYEVTLQLDDGPPRTHSAWNLILANGRTSAAGLHVAPRASLEDGLLDVIVVTDGTLPELVALGARLWLDRFLDSELVHLHKARRVAVTSVPPLRFTTDGDVVEWVPARFEVHARRLNVVVGPEYAPAST